MASVSLKRKHEDDDISIHSRSPSPAPDAMDVDTYDEHSRALAPHEVVTVETRLKPTNKGFAMLAKLGWSEGQPLGLTGDGRVDPIPFELKNDFTGVGQISQDVRVAEATVSQRRGLDSERQTKESEDQRRLREDDAARRSAIAIEVSDTLKAFYCSLCDKQFKNVAQYDEHTNSYAHHHKARFRDMQNNVRIKPADEVEKRKEKERKREEKELRKIAAANGIRMAKSTAAAALAPVTEGTSPIPPPPASSPSGSNKPGWAAVSVAAPSPPAPTLSTLPAPLTDTPQPPPTAAPSLAPASPLALNLAETEARPSKAQASRSGWQKFQKSNSRRH